MIRRILIVATLALSALFLFGCEGETKYITTADIPAAPVGVYSITGDGYVDIYWQANNDGGITEGYGVYRYVGTNGDVDEYELLGTVNASSSQVEEYGYQDAGLQNGVTYWYAVNAYNDYGESELSYYDAEDTPRPEGDDVASDFRQFPSEGGFDFSRGRVVTANEAADVWFEFDPDLGEFFLWAANDGVDIQPWGWADELNWIDNGDPGNGSGWSEVGWLEIQAGYAVLVWTADDHYGVILVTATNDNNFEVSFDWAYQTDEGNPQLKRAPKKSPPHAENYGRRSGN